MMRCLRYCIIFTSFILPGAQADTAEATREAHATLVEPATDTILAQQPQANISAEQNQAIQHYRQQVDRLESTGGVYQVQLSEVLLSLGNIYLSLHHYKDAVAAFERALQITRVNDGLYSLNQAPLLEKLITAGTDLKDWKNVDRYYYNLYWINKRHYGANNPALLALIARLGRWHLKAYELLPKDQSFSHLLDAEQLYNKAAKIIELENGKEDIRLINTLYGVALANYQIAVEVSNASDFDAIRVGFRDSGQRRHMLQEEQARGDLILQSYTRGKKAMKRIVEINANNPILPVDTHAMALTLLGDWYLLFNKRNSAAEKYKEAYQLMISEGIDKKEIDKLFGHPRTLPAIRLPLQNVEKIGSETPNYVLASFDVSPSGKAQNIEIIESRPSDNVTYIRRAKKSIATTKFRPRYENGEPVLTTGVSLRYVFTD